MSTEKLKRIVAHPKFYTAVGGKLQHIPIGTEMTVTAEQAKRLGSKLADPSQRESLDATEEGGKLKALQKENTAHDQAMAQMAAQLEALQKENTALKAKKK